MNVFLLLPIKLKKENATLNCSFVIFTRNSAVVLSHVLQLMVLNSYLSDICTAPDEITRYTHISDDSVKKRFFSLFITIFFNTYSYLFCKICTNERIFMYSFHLQFSIGNSLHLLPNTLQTLRVTPALHHYT